MKVFIIKGGKKKSKPVWCCVKRGLDWRRMFGHLCVTSSWNQLGFCCRTTIQNAPASLPLNNWRKVKWTLGCPWQSSDLDPTEMLWHDLENAVHAQNPSSVTQLQRFCKNAWLQLLLLRLAQPVIRFGEQSLFYTIFFSLPLIIKTLT